MSSRDHQTEVQPQLIDSQPPPAKRSRAVRKTRIDKGVRRKPDPTARDLALAYFAGLEIADKQRFIDDCSLILRFCDPAFVKTFNDYVPSKEVHPVESPDVTTIP